MERLATAGARDTAPLRAHNGVVRKIRSEACKQLAERPATLMAYVHGIEVRVNL